MLSGVIYVAHGKNHFTVPAVYVEKRRTGGGELQRLTEPSKQWLASR